MSLILKSNASAIRPRNSTYFGAQGGTAPYTYSVQAGGAGGSINSSGLYTAPAQASYDPKKSYDTVVVTDALGATANLPILVAEPLGLVCEIIQKYMGLAKGRVYIYNQKIDQPTDSGLYIAIGVLSSKTFGNVNKTVGSESTMVADQYVSTSVQLDFNVISRSTEALYRKEEVLLALNSIYSQQQQEANGFYIAPLTTDFKNISDVDGAAIPYRFNMTVSVQYSYSKTVPVEYFDNFEYEIITEP